MAGPANVLGFSYIYNSPDPDTTTIMNRHLPFIGLLALSPCLASAGELPGLPPPGQQAYREYQKADNHRAFAIASGGTWAWHAGADSPDIAEESAIDACQAHTRQKCVLYASDERLVFKEKQWPELWGPYADRQTAARAKPGTQPGNRLANLAFRDAQGKPWSLDKLSGKVVVVHLWGSWCPPCRKEMPELAGLYKAMAERKDVAFVFLQMREPYATSLEWAKQQRLELPLADSGSRDENDDRLRLGDDTRIIDREIARTFPTTYVLDKRGLIIFSHVGAVHDWPHYEALLRHAAIHSGK
jgi:thiol-disulfide isomerase/thioredoxin